MFDRFFFNDDGTLVDRTIEWSNPYAKTGSWDAKSYLYVSSFFPFNHKYFDISTANDQAGTLSVEIWYNGTWKSVVDILDETDNGTSSLRQSGNIWFTPDEDYGWDMEGDSSDITELSTVKVYNAFWMRFGFNAGSDSALVINYIGHRFCDDNALFSYYPILNNSAVMTRFKAGKTDWKEQEVSASRMIVTDLKSRDLIISSDQVLDSRRFETACVHKTAEIIFMGLGDSYSDYMTNAKKSHDEAMNMKRFGIDVNASGTLERSEQARSTRYMTR